MIFCSRIFTFGVAAALLFTGCRRAEIRVYTAPKDQADVADQPADAHAHANADAPDAHSQAPEPLTPPASPAQAERARPEVTWTLPAGWKEAPTGKVNLAQFAIQTGVGDASVSITPLPNLAGKESAVINMWRAQVGQGPMEEAALANALVPADVAGEKGQLFEISGTRDGATTRIITAILHRPDASWFFKLSGNEAATAALKPVYLEFLKSVRIGGPKSSTTPTAPAPVPAQP